MGWGGGWQPYVSVAERRLRAARELARRGKRGASVSPVCIVGRTIASTFWGKAWCDNLERYSDYASRLPRGRSYVRSGSVVDLQLAQGRVVAAVSGTELYDVTVEVAAVAAARWRAVRADCAGGIDSLVELLQGRLAARTMERICAPRTGLFPEPRELSFACTCPDIASMCKHVAAVLYGGGARLDAEPALLFTLRGVDPAQLVAAAGDGLARTRRRPASAKVLASSGLSELFGIDLAEEPAATAAAPPTRKRGAPRAKQPTSPKQQRTKAPSRRPARR